MAPCFDEAFPTSANLQYPMLSFAQPLHVLRSCVDSECNSIFEGLFAQNVAHILFCEEISNFDCSQTHWKQTFPMEKEQLQTK